MKYQNIKVQIIHPQRAIATKVTLCLQLTIQVSVRDVIERLSSHATHTQLLQAVQNEQMKLQITKDKALYNMHHGSEVPP